MTLVSVFFWDAKAITVVVPPAMELREPVVKLSPVGLLSWAKWTWLSTPPGVM
jgi:hypothetical protein